MFQLTFLGHVFLHVYTCLLPLAFDVRFDVLTITEKHAVSGLAHPEMHQCPVPPVALHGAWSNMVANCNSS